MDDQTIKETRAPKMRCLIMVPTRELCMQVCQHLTQISKAVGIRVVPIVGGISHQKQERLLSKHPPEIVVATPGRLWEMIREGQKHVSDFSSLKFLVLDEADRMVHQGHYEELTSVFQLVRQNCLHTDDVSKMKNADRLQTFVFSATLTLPSSMKKRLRKVGFSTYAMLECASITDYLFFVFILYSGWWWIQWWCDIRSSDGCCSVCLGETQNC